MTYNPNGYPIPPHVKYGISSQEADSVLMEIMHLDDIDDIDDLEDSLASYDELEERAPHGLSSRAAYKRDCLQAIYDTETDGDD